MQVSRKVLKEKAEESAKAYEEQTEKVAGLEKELDDVNAKIGEIQSKGKLNLTDSEELSRLQVQNDKLSTQLEIEKEILETKRQQAEVDLYNAVISEDSTKDGTIANIEWLIKEYENNLYYIEYWQDELNKALANGNETLAEQHRQTIVNLEGEARKYKLKILEETASINELSKNLDRSKTSGQEAGEAIDLLNQKVSEMFNLSDENPVDGKIEAVNAYAQYMQAEGERQLAKNQERRAAVLADYEENLKAKVTELERNLTLRKISEDEYYQQLGEYITQNRNLESEEYYKQLDRYNNYLDKKSTAADKAAADEEKVEKELQDAVTKAQKEAETERVNAIKASWDKITRMKDRGEIDEEAEYKLKAQLVKEYCDENEDTWDSYYKWLYDYTKKQEDEIADAKLKAWEDNSKKLSDTLEKSYEDIKKQKEQVKKDLQGIDLTETVKDKDGNDVLVLTDLDAEIKKIDKYEASLEKLRQSGISDSLMNEIMKKSYASGDRQAFIDQLLGLSPEKLQLYYDDWERYQAKLEEAADNSVADKLEETNQAAADGVKDIFRNIPSEAYAEGVETARQYLQGIIDSMGGVDAAAALRLGNIADRAAVQSNPNLSSTEKLIASGKLIPASTPININLNDKAYIKTTIADLISMGRITGGNVFNL